MLPGLLEVNLGHDAVVLEIAEAGAGKIRQQPGAKKCQGLVVEDDLE